MYVDFSYFCATNNFYDMAMDYNLPKFNDSMLYFRCPNCRKQFNINEASVIPVNTKSKHVGTKISGRTVTRTYQDTYYHIRFCPSCAKKRSKKISYLSRSVMIIYLLFVILYYFLNWEKLMANGGIGNVIGMVFAFLLLGLIVFAILGWIIHLVFDKTIDIEQAAKDNAIKNPFFDL